jgi:hypothetical protein
VTIFTPNATSVASQKRGYRAADFDKFQSLQSGLSVLASRYAGEPVHGDIVRMAAQVARLRAGAL